jgi:chromosome segregation ATPase
MAVSTDTASSTVDRRREQSRMAAAQAERNRMRVGECEEALAEQDRAAREHRAAIEAARAALARHKSALAAVAARRGSLETAVTKARRAAAKADAKARRAEQRYDDAVLAGVVAREKEADLTAHQDGSSWGDGAGPKTPAATGSKTPTVTREPTPTGERVKAR